MSSSKQADQLIELYTQMLLNLIEAQSFEGPRTYGFEYEFLPHLPLMPHDLLQIESLLPELGFRRHQDCYRNEAGLGVAFEPGGQIEYLSPPLRAAEIDRVQELLTEIEATNRHISRTLGINYLPVDYLPDRGDVPLCLTRERYRLLHERVGFSGSRGREMMKGTASIHLHAVMRNIGELVPLFMTLCELSRTPPFQMSAQRRDIWNNTDPCRCGLLYIGLDMALAPENVVEELVRVGMLADVLGENQPFWKIADNDFEHFLYHLTTIFTDVRLNIKGPTLELRTPDSRPLSAFLFIWEKFIETIQNTNFADLS